MGFILKTAKLFVIGVYLHLILSIFIPIHIVLQGSWNAVSITEFWLYFFMVGVVQILGWVYVGMAVKTYGQHNTEKIKKGFTLCKLATIPFYILNFMYSFFVWFTLVGASRGILIFLVPIPITITCLFVIQSGCVGVCYIKCLKKQGLTPSGWHFLLQFLPVFDVISTIYLLKKYPITQK